jgi:hypothetical protein
VTRKEFNQLAAQVSDLQQQMDIFRRNQATFVVLPEDELKAELYKGYLHGAAYKSRLYRAPWNLPENVSKEDLPLVLGVAKQMGIEVGVIEGQDRGVPDKTKFQVSVYT